LPGTTSGRGKRWTATAFGVVFVLVVCVCLIALGILREVALHDSDLHAAEVETANLARSLVQHAEDTAELLDNAVTAVAHQVQTEGLTGQGLQRLQGVLDLKKRTTPRLRRMSVYAADGQGVASSDSDYAQSRNNGDRDYFQYHRQSQSLAALIGKPIESRSNGEWIITVTRRINDADGGFAGVVAASIGVDYFQRYYSQFEMGNRGSIALVHGDGTVLARAPFRDNYVGRSLSASPRIRDATNQQSGLVHYRSSLDGVERISAFHRSGRYPLMVLAARSKADVLANWQSGLISRMALVTFLTIAVGLLGLQLVRKMAEHQRMLRLVQSREADFRLLAEASSDMVTRITFGGVLAYVSPAATSVVGWTPQQLTGTDALAGLHPLDRAKVEDIVDSLRRGDITEARISYRTRHRVRGQIWLESVMTATRNPETALIDGVVAVSRDVSDQKEKETRLSDLALKDGLTDVANRRHFDSQLAVERDRARRNASSLSLLIIDVDHFKNFNDTYGHPAGDECLKLVASALRAEATRPRDLAARFGGEEFVLLLPDTDDEGCRAVAERLRQAIADLGIKHASSSVAEHVTVSIGGATIPGEDGETTAEALVESADGALYAAKAAGRNRVRISATTRRLFGKTAEQGG
jgi:diguanylate cyclase (GGDEF)-like protein/PAS domain S-box-containing protein